MIISSVNPKDRYTNFLWNVVNLTEMRLAREGVVTEVSLDRNHSPYFKGIF